MPIAINLAKLRRPNSATARPVCTKSSAAGGDNPQLQINAQNCVHCRDLRHQGLTRASTGSRPKGRPDLPGCKVESNKNRALPGFCCSQFKSRPSTKTTGG